MCHLVREDLFESQSGREAGPAPARPLRPRRAGVVAALLVGGFAVAALLAPSKVSPLSSPVAQHGEAPAALASLQAVPGAAGLERTALPVDDEVPTAPGTAQSGAAPCHHGF